MTAIRHLDVTLSVTLRLQPYEARLPANLRLHANNALQTAGRDYDQNELSNIDAQQLLMRLLRGGALSV